MKVQEENWYKPQPGEPYRPLIAMPKQILQMNPLFGLCTDNFFTGYDPPKTLNRATALSPTTTTGDYEHLTIAPKPSQSLDAGARKTLTGENPKITNADTPAVEQPALQFKDEGSNPENEPSHPIKLKNLPTPSALDPEETSGNPQQGGTAQGAPGGEASPNPPPMPTQTTPKGVEIEGPHQNIASASSNIPAQANNAKTIGGELGEDVDQPQSAVPKPTTTTDETTGDPRKKNTSEMNASKEASSLPGIDGAPAQEKDPSKSYEPPQPNTALPKLDPFRASPDEIFGVEGAPSKTNEPKKETTAPETNEDLTKEKDTSKLKESPHSKIAPSDSDPLRASPNQIYGIEGATSFHSRQSEPSPKTAHKEADTPIQHDSPGRIGIFGHIFQTESVSRPSSSRIPDPPTSFVAAQAVTTTHTIAAATSRTALPPLPPGASMNGTLDTSSVSVRGPQTSASSFDASEIGSLGDTPPITAGSGADTTDSLSPTQITSSMGRINRNIAADVRVFTDRAWVVVAMLMLMLLRIG